MQRRSHHVKPDLIEARGGEAQRGGEAPRRVAVRHNAAERCNETARHNALTLRYSGTIVQCRYYGKR